MSVIKKLFWSSCCLFSLLFIASLCVFGYNLTYILGFNYNTNCPTNKDNQIKYQNNCPTGMLLIIIINSIALFIGLIMLFLCCNVLDFKTLDTLKIKISKTSDGYNVGTTAYNGLLYSVSSCCCMFVVFCVASVYLSVCRTCPNPPQ